MTTSGGSDAPTEKEPINANSSVAPITIPVSMSPSTSPVNSPVTIGLEISDVPNAYSDWAINATSPSKSASTIICPQEGIRSGKKLFTIVRHQPNFYLYSASRQLPKLSHFIR
ncbi:Uncharacterised protein [Salmonella enterica subsp. enterica serovar Bovismorbificans]|uniref:Uncharacterized protein n=1 Tax=Salmonella enterica subsp. enterica serovar Bovismorbificans TaxID=58097 RepID=A0A655D8Y9_SALET|nr:Uncharacterised protein [Salmonella enterica subsp. enterica serovar Bovismorbificans]CPR50256.1 Uncharacterised protein [Salmonella enterica subsp. enterica serovar Bovismorbificans]